jgi:glycine cleavage system H lipoate-binding protein
VRNTENEELASFVKWILTGGQQFLGGSGYSELLITERQSSVEKLNNARTEPLVSASGTSVFRILFIFLAAILVSVLAIDLVLKMRRSRKAKLVKQVDSISGSIAENSLLIPKGIYYDKTHTWAFMEQNGMLKVGIDDFLQHVTGPVTRIKMKKTGQEVKKGEEIMSVIHNGKQLNLYSPVSGVIIEQNKKLEEDASLINSSPYNEGWVYRMEPSNWQRENNLLFMAEKQRQFIVNEFTRLKDFLAKAFGEDSAQLSFLVLQDGGELRDGVLSDLGPEVWEDFQTNFIDPSRQIWFYEMF